jgi:hypothetical protein
MNFARDFQFPLQYTQILTLIIFILQATSKILFQKIEFSIVYEIL